MSLTSILSDAVRSLRDKIQSQAGTASPQDLAYLAKALESIGGRVSLIEVEDLAQDRMTAFNANNDAKTAAFNANVTSQTNAATTAITNAANTGSALVNTTITNAQASAIATANALVTQAILSPTHFFLTQTLRG